MPWFPLRLALGEWLAGWGPSQPLALLGPSRFFASGHNRNPQIGLVGHGCLAHATLAVCWLDARLIKASRLTCGLYRIPSQGLKCGTGEGLSSRPICR